MFRVEYGHVPGRVARLSCTEMGFHAVETMGYAFAGINGTSYALQVY